MSVNKKQVLGLIFGASCLFSICHAGNSRLHLLLATTVGRSVVSAQSARPLLSSGELSFSRIDQEAATVADEVLKQFIKQGQITESAREWASNSLVQTYNHAPDGHNESKIDEECELVELWLLERSVMDTGKNPSAVVLCHDSELPKPGACCSSFGSGDKPYLLCQTATDDRSGDEDSEPADDEADNTETDKETDTDVEIMDTSANSLPVSFELRLLTLRKVEEAPDSCEDSPTKEKTVATSEDEEDESAGYSSSDEPPEKKRRKSESSESPRQQAFSDIRKKLPNTRTPSAHGSGYHGGEHTCPDCKKILPNSKALSAHKRSRHSGKRFCLECYKVFPNIGALATHKSGYHSGKQTCPICRKVLSNAQALSDHKRGCHSGERTCPVCQQNLPNVQVLSEHKRRFHSGEQTCSVCQEILPNTIALSEHISRCHLGQQTCPDCQRVFSNPRSLSTHKSSYHRGKKTCPDCQQVFPNVQAFYQHKKAHCQQFPLL